MPRAVEARAWWADVEDVRERIERRREREQSRARESPQAGARAAAVPAARRGVREVRAGKHLMLVRSGAPTAPAARDVRRRPRPVERVGPRPDMIAAWAVALGFLLMIVAVLSAHG